MIRSDYTRTKTAASEPVSLTQAKNYIKENYGSDLIEDKLVLTMIEAARVWLEDETRRAFVKQTVVYQAFDDEGQITELVVPYQPIIDITEVVSIDIEGTETTMTLNTDYFKRGLSGGTETIMYFNKMLATVPVGSATADSSIRVTYSAGYADNADIPEDFNLAIMKLVAENYVNREASVDWSIGLVPYDVQTTINHYKVWDI